jgi:hypothetical protein
MARIAHSLGKEATELSGQPETCLCAHLVPKSRTERLDNFEIDSKNLSQNTMSLWYRGWLIPSIIVSILKQDAFRVTDV